MSLVPLEEIRKLVSSAPPPALAMCRHSKGMATYKAGSGLSPDTECVRALILDF